MQYSSAIKRKDLLINVTTWLNLRITMLCERNQKKTHKLYDSIYIRVSRKYKLFYKDRKQLVAWTQGWNWGGEGGRDYKRPWGNFWKWLYVHYPSWGDGFTGAYIMSKCVNLHTLDVYILLYVNYTSMKLLNINNNHCKIQFLKLVCTWESSGKF